MKRARLDRRTRRAIQNSKEPVRRIAEKYIVSCSTVQKWRSRPDTKDKLRKRRSSPNIDEIYQQIIIDMRHKGFTLGEICARLQASGAKTSVSAIQRVLKRVGLTRKIPKGGFFWNERKEPADLDEQEDDFDDDDNKSSEEPVKRNMRDW